MAPIGHEPSPPTFGPVRYPHRTPKALNLSVIRSNPSQRDDSFSEGISLEGRPYRFIMSEQFLANISQTIMNKGQRLKTIKPSFINLRFPRKLNLRLRLTPCHWLRNNTEALCTLAPSSDQRICANFSHGSFY